MRRAFAVILAGGKGERFWPLSTGRRPKQLLSLVGGKPLLAQAVERLRGLIPPDHIYVITGRELAAPCRRAAPSLPPRNIVGEPFGRDTAAAIALGAALIKRRCPSASFCVLTADHVIRTPALFRRTLREALALAEREDVLITVGIPPREPNTGYGYIEAARKGRARGGVVFHKAKRFVEKPDARTARAYCRAGNFFWNSGMFVWSVDSFQRALSRHARPCAALLARLADAHGGAVTAARVEAEYRKLEKISIDYALMEKAGNIVMARGDFPWDDVGTWTALENHVRRDGKGNAVVGSCEMMDADRNIVVSGGRLTALLGVSGVVVVQAAGVTLVCARDRAQDVKKLVARLRSSGRYGKVL